MCIIFVTDKLFASNHNRDNVAPVHTMISSISKLSYFKSHPGKASSWILDFFPFSCSISMSLLVAEKKRYNRIAKSTLCKVITNNNDWWTWMLRKVLKTNKNFQRITLFLSCVFQTDSGKSFTVIVRFDTEVDLLYFHHGGILNYMVRKMLK